MRITRTIAEKAASKMTVKHYEEVKKIKEELNNKVTEIYLATIPSDVIKIYEDCRSFVKTTSAVYVNGFSLNHELVHLNKEVPSKGSYPTILIESNEDAKKVSKLISSYVEARDNADEKEREITEVLIALGSTKNVLEQFPEAIDYIENAPKVRNLPVNLKELRKEFSKEA